jgi:hypothetical protein
MALNESTVAVKNIRLQAFTEGYVIFTGINGSHVTGNTESGFEVIAKDEQMRYLLRSTTLPITFDPKGILIKSAILSKNPQKKGDNLNLTIELQFEEIPSKLYSKMTIDLPIGFNSLMKIGDIQGFSGNQGTNHSGTNSISLFSQLPDIEPLIIDTNVKIELKNVSSSDGRLQSPK